MLNWLLLMFASYWKKTRKHRLLKNSNNFNFIFHMMTRSINNWFCTCVYLSPLQTDATLSANNSQRSWMSHVASVSTPCCLLLCVIENIGTKFETSQTLESKLPTFLLLCDHRDVSQQCWICLHSSSNIVGATHMHYTWSPWRQESNNFAW